MLCSFGTSCQSKVLAKIKCVRCGKILRLRVNFLLHGLSGESDGYVHSFSGGVETPCRFPVQFHDEYAIEIMFIANFMHTSACVGLSGLDDRPSGLRWSSGLVTRDARLIFWACLLQKGHIPSAGTTVLSERPCKFIRAIVIHVCLGPRYD